MIPRPSSVEAIAPPVAPVISIPPCLSFHKM
jgi:hypothetical protein